MTRLARGPRRDLLKKLDIEQDRRDVWRVTRVFDQGIATSGWWRLRDPLGRRFVWLLMRIADVTAWVTAAACVGPRVADHYLGIWVRRRFHCDSGWLPPAYNTSHLLFMNVERSLKFYLSTLFITFYVTVKLLHTCIRNIYRNINWQPNAFNVRI